MVRYRIPKKTEGRQAKGGGMPETSLNLLGVLKLPWRYWTFLIYVNFPIGRLPGYRA